MTERQELELPPVAPGARDVMLAALNGAVPMPKGAIDLALHALVDNGYRITRDPSVTIEALGKLTNSERRVLRMLVSTGLPNAAIAARLGVTEKTVKNHVAEIYSKLGTHSRGETIARIHEAAA